MVKIYKNDDYCLKNSPSSKIEVETNKEEEAKKQEKNSSLCKRDEMFLR